MGLSLPQRPLLVRVMRRLLVEGVGLERGRMAPGFLAWAVLQAKEYSVPCVFDVSQWKCQLSTWRDRTHMSSPGWLSEGGRGWFGQGHAYFWLHERRYTCLGKTG